MRVRKAQSTQLATVKDGCSSGEAGGLACQLAAVFSEDFLAPTLAGALFPDLIQRFVPTGWLAPILPQGTPVFLPDRQQFLEAAWERALPEWQSRGHAKGFIDVVRPADADAARPALFLAATEVEKGRRWIASDVRLDRQLFVDAVDTLTGRQLDDGEPISCADRPSDPDGEFHRCMALAAAAAAGLSARFPYVSPPGMLTFADQAGEERTYHLLDGGFVDNSAAMTAAEILKAIRGWCEPADAHPGTLKCELKRSHKDAEPERVGGTCPSGYKCDSVYVRPAVLLLTNEPARPATEQREAAERPLTAWFAELGDPIRALFNARAGRGRAAHDFLLHERSLMAGCGNLALDVVLQGDDGRNDDENVPLGWLVRGKTAQEMERRVKNELNSSSASTWLRTVYGSAAHDEACDDAVPIASIER